MNRILVFLQPMFLFQILCGNRDNKWHSKLEFPPYLARELWKSFFVGDQDNITCILQFWLYISFMCRQSKWTFVCIRKLKNDISAHQISCTEVHLQIVINLMIVTEI